MSTPQDKVLELVAAGKVSPGEGEQLLKAMGPRAPGFWRWLFIPAEKISGMAALLVGALAAGAGLLLSRWGVRFDGAMDIHRGGSGVSLLQALVDQVLAWPFLAGFFWVAGRAAGKVTRIRDLLGAVGLARIPFLATAVLTLGMTDIPSVSTPGPLPTIDPIWIALAFAMLPLVAWGFTLLVTGYRTVTGLRGRRLVLSVIAALLAAEVSSKLFVVFVHF